MFDTKFIEKSKRMLIFLVIFTLFFILFFKTLFYTIPFILAFIIALCARPLMRVFRDKLKLNDSISALLSTFLVFTTVVVLLTTLIYKIADEAKQVAATLPSVAQVQKFLEGYITEFNILYDNIDPSIIKKAQEQLSTVLSSTFDITAKILNSVVSLAISLPVFFLVIFVVLLSTYFFTKDQPNLSEKIIGMFAANQKEKVSEVLHEANKMLGGYVKAYSMIVTLSFLQVLIGFLFLRVKYALLLSILCWILDLVPVLGIFVVFAPLAIIYALSGNYFVAVGLVILWLLVTIVRQVLEPKIVSSSLDLHPLAVLAAIFIGLTAYGFLGMIYILSLLVLYKVLNKTGII